MRVVLLLLTVFLSGPFLAVGFDLARRRRGQQPLATGRLLTASGIAGAISITPLALVVSLGAYGGMSYLAVAWIAGMLYGILVSGAVVGLRGLRDRHRDV